PRVEAAAVRAASEENDERLFVDDQALFNARVDPRTAARPASALTLAVDPRRFHFFDVRTGASLLVRHGVQPSPASVGTGGMRGLRLGEGAPPAPGYLPQVTTFAERLSRKPAGYAFTMRRTLAIYVGLMVTLLLAALDQTIVATALPKVVSDLGGLTQYAWVFTAYMLTSTVSVPVYGRLGDVHGRRPL